MGINVAYLAKNNFNVAGCYKESSISMEGVKAIKLDLRDALNMEAVIREVQPDLILHTAALANVDHCEADPVVARELNVTIAKNLAEFSNSVGCKFVHISTDQLFDGQDPWRTEIDHASPLNVYGVTKLAAEGAVMNACPNALVVRTNFFGWGNSKRKSFSDWILNGLESGQKLNMFTDVFYTPILINDLADVIFELVDLGATGIYNVCGSDRLSKHEFGLRLAEVFGYSTENINESKVADVSLLAKRPSDMSLNCEKAESLLGLKMPSVSAGLDRLKDLRELGWPQAMENAHSEVSETTPLK